MSLKMKELPESERPYEKAQMYGTEKLSDSELLAIIIKCGTKEDTSVGLAQKILNLNKEKKQNDLRFLQNLSIEELMKIKGIGKVKAIQIMATCELAKRMSKPIHSLNIKIKGTDDVTKLLADELKYEQREILKLLILNSKNILIKKLDIAYGGTDFARLEPKIILAEPIKMNAPKIVLVHNHPSGDPTPSPGDIRMTQRLYECADIMGITLIDHVIIGQNRCDSALEAAKKQEREEMEIKAGIKRK
jgi:DNA repair protein RadC